MKTLERAKELAETMVKIGDALHRDTRAILTDMDQPLGLAVGNSLEVKEAIKTLQGQGPKDLVELVEQAGSIMLEQAKIVKTHEEGIARIKAAIDDRSGFKKLVELFKAQGGDYSYIEHPEKFPVAKREIAVKAEHSGYVKRIDSLTIGVSAMKLGAGRATMEDEETGKDAHKREDAFDGKIGDIEDPEGDKNPESEQHIDEPAL